MVTNGFAPERVLVRTDILALVFWGALLAPAGIVLHELGHFIVGLSLGFPVKFNVGSVSGGATLGLAPESAVALQASAGPLVTIALMAIAAWGLKNRSAPLWGFALAITAPLRFIVGGTYLFWVAKSYFENTDFQGTPNFDEYNAAVAVGLSPVWLVSIQMCILTLYWTWVMTRARHSRRLVSLGCVLVGAITGIALWMSVIGPTVLALT